MHAVYLFAVGKNAHGINVCCWPHLVRGDLGTPAADSIKVLQRDAPRINSLVTIRPGFLFAMYSKLGQPCSSISARNRRTELGMIRGIGYLLVF